MFLAAGCVPRSLQPSLMPRSSRDQGLITGVAVMGNYMIGNALHDALESLGRQAARNLERNNPRRRRMAGAVDAAAIVLGLGLKLAVPRREHEQLGRGALRVAGWYTAWTGFAGLSVVALQETLAQIDARTGNRYNLKALPVAIPAGAALSVAIEYRRRRRAVAQAPSGQVEHPRQINEGQSITIGRSLAVGAGVTGILAIVASAERAAALATERVIASRLPAYRRFARPLGHALAFGSLTAAGYAGSQYIYNKIERGAGRVEAGFSRAPKSPLMSGGLGSRVAFETLTQYPRRHVLTYLRPERIREVMGEPPRAEPIRIYVGLDSAGTVNDRVRLALDELERTGALDRALLLLISPTGTGWIDPNVIEAAEFFTRGNIASVAMQYSKRPSPLSLDRVSLGHAQNSMLWSAIHERLTRRSPEQRPKVAIFGESLGAHTSQDVFIHQGTDGLRALGIDAALWFGTPFASEWKSEVLDGRRADVDSSLVGVFDHWEQLQQLDAEQRDRLRYIMVTHENDAVADFGVDLLLRCPDWMAERRPAALPPQTRWYPITTFLQTAIDMKNAMHVVPGQFEARGHDYRADTARFVLAALRLQASDEQLARVEQALRRIEEVEGRWTERHLSPSRQP